MAKRKKPPSPSPSFPSGGGLLGARARSRSTAYDTLVSSRPRFPRPRFAPLIDEPMDGLAARWLSISDEDRCALKLTTIFESVDPYFFRELRVPSRAEPPEPVQKRLYRGSLDDRSVAQHEVLASGAGTYDSQRGHVTREYVFGVHLYYAEAMLAALGSEVLRLALLAEALRGLDVFHQAGLVHGGLTPKRVRLSIEEMSVPVRVVGWWHTMRFGSVDEQSAERAALVRCTHGPHAHAEPVIARAREMFLPNLVPKPAEDLVRDAALADAARELWGFVREEVEREMASLGALVEH